MAMQTTQTQTILPEWYTQYAKDVLGKATAATSEPYRAYAAPRIAGFQPEQEQAFSGYKATMGTYAPYLEASTAALGRGTGSFTAPGVAQQYMNPYLQNVVSGIGTMAGRNLYENILPQLNRTFVGGGTFGGKRSADFTQRAVRDTQSQILGQQMQALNEGYKTAADLYGTEASRAIQAAPYFASIGEQEQTQRLRDLAGLEAIGAKRQGLAQTSADLAYQDFERQRDFPLYQAQQLAGIGGTPSAQGAGTAIRTEPGTSKTASTLSTIGSIVGILGKSGAFGSGGWLGLKDGGEVERPVKDGKRNIKHPMHGLGWLKDMR
jgi:hypothetical protein